MLELVRRLRHFVIVVAILLVEAGPMKSQPTLPAGQVDLFMGVDFNYRDISYDKLYEFLINLTPGLKWNLGRQWQVAAQALIPVYNDSLLSDKLD